MTEAEIIKKTAAYLEQKFKSDRTGHDWWHIQRVWRLAKRIGKTEPGVDMFVVELGALLHDIADWKFHGNNFEAGPKAARQWLTNLKTDEETIQHVEDIIRNVSFKGAGVKQDLKTREGQIVFDADKLDAIGAIGVARTFAYFGSTGNPIYDPSIKPILHNNFESYAKLDGTAINYFKEKLLLLKDRMYTKTGRRLAKRRHKFLQTYLKEFYGEWDGEL